MKKKLIIAGVSIVVIAVVILGVVLNSFMGVVVKKVMTSAMPKIIGAPVSMKTCDLSLLGGRTLIEDLKIGNPKGFKKPYSFELKKMDIKLDVFSLFSDKIVINKIVVDGMKITHEGITDSNLLQMKKNIECYINVRKGSSAEPTQTEDKADKPVANESKGEKGSGKKFVIKKIRFTNISVDMYSDLSEKALASAKLGDIKLDNVGGGDGSELSNILYDILPTILTQVSQTKINVDGSKEVLKDLKKKYNKKNLKNLDEKDIDKGVKALKSLF